MTVRPDTPDSPFLQKTEELSRFFADSETEKSPDLSNCKCKLCVSSRSNKSTFVFADSG